MVEPLVFETNRPAFAVVTAPKTCTVPFVSQVICAVEGVPPAKAWQKNGALGSQMATSL